MRYFRISPSRKNRIIIIVFDLGAFFGDALAQSDSGNNLVIIVQIVSDSMFLSSIIY